MEVVVFLFIIGVIGIITWILFWALRAIANKRNREIYNKIAKFILNLYIILIICIVIGAIIKIIHFNSIPELSVKNNQVTILDSGTGSRGSQSRYIYSEEGVLEVEEDLYYIQVAAISSTKFGFRFKAMEEGETYLAVVQIDCGELHHADVYDVVVEEDLTLNVEHVEHIKVESPESMIEQLVEKYQFQREKLEDKFNIFLDV